MNPLVAIVGRPNVGKSTLFNRIAGRRAALVQDAPGVTRDRHYADTEWAGRRFTVIDTGGLMPLERDSLSAQVEQQAQLAVEECDAVVLVVDARAGLTSLDREIAALLRKSGKPLLLAVNKVDRDADQASASDFYQLGISEVFLLSAEHGRGLTPLVDRLSALLPASSSADQEQGAGQADNAGIRVALVGRPNVGKSSLLNALLGKERVIVSQQPGTTRDPIDTEIEFQGQRFVLTDTAGIRRRAAISHRLEQVAVLAAIKAMERCDVAALVLDATEPGVEQDARLAGMADEKGRALLLLVNKWDKLSTARQADFRAQLKQRMKFVSYAPIVFTSALRRPNVEKILDLASKLNEQLKSRISTPQLNEALQQALEAKPPPRAANRPLKVYYAAQVAVAPPTFALSCNEPALFPEHYKRYLANQLRSSFQIRVPIRTLFRARSGKSKRRGD